MRGKPRHQPGPGQESVWDYPRPPRLEPSTDHIQVWYGGECIADTCRALRALETGHPPVYYLPLTDIVLASLAVAAETTWCEFKGEATYLDVVVGRRKVERAAWTYLKPSPPFQALAGLVAFHPGAMDECLVDGERVSTLADDVHGGWITCRVVGPFRGGADPVW